MKKFIFTLVSLISINAFAQLECDKVNNVKLFNSKQVISTGSKATYGTAKSLDLNASSNQQLIIENGENESSGISFDGDYVVIWSPGDQNRLLRIYDEDSMGGQNYEKAYIDGDGDYFKASDLRRKKDVTKVTDVFEKLNQINGINYVYKNEEELDLKLKSNSKTKSNNQKVRSGFIAQELENVIPEMVDIDEHGNRFVNYSGILPYLLEAIKQQQVSINEQAATIVYLRKQVEEMTKKSKNQ